MLALTRNQMLPRALYPHAVKKSATIRPIRFIRGLSDFGCGSASPGPPRTLGACHAMDGVEDLRSIRDFRLDEAGEHRQRFLPAEVAHLRRDQGRYPFLDDREVGPAGD